MAKARVAVMLSGTGTTMASLLYASRLPDCPYEIVLVASNKPEARGLQVAAAEGIPTFVHSHKGLTREAHEAIMLEALAKSRADHVALCGYMRILTPEFVARWAEYASLAAPQISRSRDASTGIGRQGDAWRLHRPPRHRRTG